MEWQIWRDYGFCALSASITAYVDFCPTRSGAVRCVGPISANECLSADVVLREMRNLTVKLESEFLEKDQYVLWGSYLDSAIYQEHEIKVLDVTCGYVPMVWLRTQLLGCESHDVEREWLVTGNTCLHKSGLSFPGINGSFVDLSVYHPENLRMCVNWLSQHASTLGAKMQNSLEFEADRFNWTPLVCNERSELGGIS